LGPDDDVTVMAAMAAGDSSALATLYDRHASLVFGLCMRILRDRGEAEEALGDIFLELWKKPDRYDASRGGVVGYLLNLTRSRALDRLRARQRHTRFTVEDRDGTDADARPDTGGAADPLRQALHGETRQQVQRALEQLAPAQRRALELAFYDGLSHSEVAEALGEPLGTIKTRIRQGMLHLKESLRPLYGGGVTS
jgi:RNA polymerase sigma-70 factor (ECF subfamily)